MSIKEVRKAMALVRAEFKKDLTRAQKDYSKKHGVPAKSETRKELYCRAQIEAMDLVIEALDAMIKEASKNRKRG